MKKVYYLSTCNTCKKIMNGLGDDLDAFDQQDIKNEPITAEQLEEMRARSASYEELFTRRSMKYRSMGLADKKLAEDDYRDLIIQEYTFLKRPVFVVGDEIFIGNAKKTVEALAEALTH